MVRLMPGYRGAKRVSPRRRASATCGADPTAAASAAGSAFVEQPVDDIDAGKLISRRSIRSASVEGRRRDQRE
jgi:hypothetical protein